MDDTCVYCLHPVDEHGPAGCEWGRDGLCPCSEHPEPYDPSAP